MNARYKFIVLLLTAGLLFGAAHAILMAAAAPNINQSFTAKQATLGMPTSADFLLKAYDPRNHDYAYATFKRLPDGRSMSIGWDRDSVVSR